MRRYDTAAVFNGTAVIPYVGTVRCDVGIRDGCIAALADSTRRTTRALSWTPATSWCSGAVPRPSRVALTHETTGGVVGKVNPSIGTEADGETLWRAVQDDRIDTSVSDHTCCAEEDKGEYLWKAPPGCGCAAGRPVRC
jgi:hypothetical protein